jgi:hypothetical protein
MSFDDGYFPRGRSTLRRVQGERAVGLLYGQRAGLDWSAPQRLAFEAAVSAVRRSRPLVPKHVRRGLNTDSFELVARTERARATV